jgi:hypothetical protein
MNELVQIVQQKTGLSPEMAETVVNTVVGYIKGKLPAGMSSGLDQLLGGAAGGDAAAAATEGEGGLAEKAKSMMAGLGGMLGNKDA